MQQDANIIVLIAACITLVTALLPFWKWVWRSHLVRHFDAKKQHYKELIERAKWYDDRTVKIDNLRKQLLYMKMYEQPIDHFKLSELCSKLDREDVKWARKIENVNILIDACMNKQDECFNNATQCREFADEVERKVLFW